jgi:hypothetical protein
MKERSTHRWAFAPRLRKKALGWRSQPAVERVREAVSEITRTAREDPVLGAEGAVLFLEKVSAALERVDGSSGAIGSAVNHAIESLTEILVAAPAGDALRDRWMERLWRAVEEDEMPYIELLTDAWGELCVTEARASRWADFFLGAVRMTWDMGRERHAYFKGTDSCLSCLFKAGRHQELLDLLEAAPHKHWHDRKWGVKALVAMGKKAEALGYAEDCRSRYENPIPISQACEEILLSSGMAEEAYRRYAIEANQKTTYLATFRSIARKYPKMNAADILADLVASTPGHEGKWFAAARSAGLLDEAIELARRTPCDPRTLIRAARDMEAKAPAFALEAGMAALRWLVEGYGYEITNLDVRAAYDHTLKAAENSGCRSETIERIRELVAGETSGERFVTKVLGREIGLGPTAYPGAGIRGPRR